MRGSPIHYSAMEMAWLEANRTMVISDYHEAFQAKFDRADISAANLHALRKRRGWKVGRAPGRTAGRSRIFSASELRWLEENCTLPITAYHAAFVERFERTDLTAENLKSLRKRRGWRTGRTGRFEKGNVSHNKGKTCPPGIGGRHPNAQRTQFKKGQEPHNTKHLGHERIRDDGYVEISVEETNPYTGYHRRYVFKHVHLWEAKNGPVPEGHCLKALDGNRQNTDPDNWEAIPKGVLPRLNGGRATSTVAYDQAPAELKPTLLTLAKVEHKVSQARRRSKGAVTA